MTSGTRLGQRENTLPLSLFQQGYARFEETPRLPCLDAVPRTLRQDVRKHPERHQRQQNHGAFHYRIAVVPHLGEKGTAVIHAGCTVSLCKNSAFALWTHPSQWAFLMPHCLKTPECHFKFLELARTANNGHVPSRANRT